METLIFIMAAHSNGQAIIFYFYFVLSFLSSLDLSGRRLDVYHTSTPDVDCANSECMSKKYAASGSLKIPDAKMAQNSPSGHHRTTLSGYNLSN